MGQSKVFKKIVQFKKGKNPPWPFWLSRRYCVYLPKLFVKFSPCVVCTFLKIVHKDEIYIFARKILGLISFLKSDLIKSNRDDFVILLTRANDIQRLCIRRQLYIIVP